MKIVEDNRGKEKREKRIKEQYKVMYKGVRREGERERERESQSVGRIRGENGMKGKGSKRN